MEEKKYHGFFSTFFNNKNAFYSRPLFFHLNPMGDLGELDFGLSKSPLPSPIGLASLGDESSLRQMMIFVMKMTHSSIPRGKKNRFDFSV